VAEPRNLPFNLALGPRMSTRVVLLLLAVFSDLLAVSPALSLSALSGLHPRAGARSAERRLEARLSRGAAPRDAALCRPPGRRYAKRGGQGGGAAHPRPS